MSINKMTITIKMDNAAFDPDKWVEVEGILRGIADQIRDIVFTGYLPEVVVDSNGNSCGTVVYDEVKNEDL